LRSSINNIIMKEVESEKEWRRYLIDEVRALKSEIKSDIGEVRRENKEIIEALTTMKVKIGIAASLIGGASGLILSYLKSKIGS
jgi:hypothetical protein